MKPGTLVYVAEPKRCGCPGKLGYIYPLPGDAHRSKRGRCPNCKKITFPAGTLVVRAPFARRAVIEVSRLRPVAGCVMKCAGKQNPGQIG